MFAWAPLPPALREMGSLEFSKQLLTHAKVAVAPGVGYGEDGEGFVRIAMVENEQRIRQAARNIRKFLSMHGVNTPSVAARSEEHTSELQSLMRISYAVFCLKNKNLTSV